MAKKERNHDPAGAQRKLDRKNELKKLKKQRLERKEQLFESDPKALKAEIARLKHLTELRAEAGTNKKMHEKIEELSAVLQEAERRRATREAEQPSHDFAPSYSGGSLDLSAITGRKRKAAPDGEPESAPNAEAARPAAVSWAQQAAELVERRAKAVFGAAAASSSTAEAAPTLYAPLYPQHPHPTPTTQPAMASAADAHAEVPSLPSGWKQAQAPDGRTYYWYKAADGTKKTQWKRPSAEPGAEPPAVPVADPPAPESPSDRKSQRPDPNMESPPDRKSPRPDPTSALVPVAVGGKVFVAQVKIKETASED